MLPRPVLVQTVSETSGHVWLSEPKTLKGRPLSPDQATVAVLRDHRKRMLEERLLVGPDSTDRGFVFHQPDGSWLHPTPSATSSFAEPLPSAYQGSSSAPCATPGRRSPPDKASIRRSSKNALATAQSL